MRKRDVLWAEQRAAAIVASMMHEGGWPSSITGPEQGGWMRRGDNRERGCSYESREWHAGYLAACVWYECAFEVTAKTITDEQIAELRAALLRESDNQYTNDTDATGDALRDYSAPQYVYVRDIGETVREIARERCAEIYNERLHR